MSEKIEHGGSTRDEWSEAPRERAAQPGVQPSDPFEMVLEFHHRFGVSVGRRPGLPSAEVVELRRRLISEEVAELEEALAAGDVVEVADALADILYVVYGAAAAFGIDIRPIFAEVHRSNMAKVGGPTRADGKVLKPAGWLAPRVVELLAGMSLADPSLEDPSPDDDLVRR